MTTEWRKKRERQAVLEKKTTALQELRQKELEVQSNFQNQQSEGIELRQQLDQAKSLLVEIESMKNTLLTQIVSKQVFLGSLNVLLSIF